MLYVIGGILALALGIYIGLGMPGMPGREDRVVTSGRARRPKRQHTPLDYIKPPKPRR
jgi:hypothetical protein